MTRLGSCRPQSIAACKRQWIVKYQTATYRQQYSQRATYSLQYSLTATYRQQYSRRATYRLQYSLTATYRQQYSQRATYRLQYSLTATYRQQYSQKATYRLQYSHMIERWVKQEQLNQSSAQWHSTQGECDEKAGKDSKFCAEQHSNTGRDSNHILLQSKLDILIICTWYNHWDSPFIFQDRAAKWNRIAPNIHHRFHHGQPKPRVRAIPGLLRLHTVCLLVSIFSFVDLGFFYQLQWIHSLSWQRVYTRLSINAGCTCFYKSTTISLKFYTFIYHISSLCLRSIM